MKTSGYPILQQNIKDNAVHCEAELATLTYPLTIYNLQQLPCTKYHAHTDLHTHKKITELAVTSALYFHILSERERSKERG